MTDDIDVEDLLDAPFKKGTEKVRATWAVADSSVHCMMQSERKGGCVGLLCVCVCV